MFNFDVSTYEYELVERDLSLISEDASRVLEYWRGLSRDNKVPSWKEFNLLQLPTHLVPILHVFEMVDDGEDFACLFWGSGMRTSLGREVTGKKVSMMHSSPAFCQNILAHMRKVIATGEPLAATSSVTDKGLSIRIQNLLRLPLTDESGRNAYCVTLTEHLEDKTKINEYLNRLDN